ncbi:MAG: hypothetical protein AB7U83_16915 [Vicinamibacterales bacterium]
MAPQDLVVTAVALWAAVVIARRVLGFVRPKRPAPGCAHCPSGQAAARPGADEHPLVFIKSSRH